MNPLFKARIVVLRQKFEKLIPPVRHETLVEIRPEILILDEWIHSREWARHGNFSRSVWHLKGGHGTTSAGRQLIILPKQPVGALLCLRRPRFQAPHLALARTRPHTNLDGGRFGGPRYFGTHFSMRTSSKYAAPTPVRARLTRSLPEAGTLR